jgi:hypothetical protein
MNAYVSLPREEEMVYKDASPEPVHSGPEKSPPQKTRKTPVKGSPPSIRSSPFLGPRFKTQDRTAQPLEPILFPKLRIYFADFPYLHCSMRLEAFHLGDLMRL